MLSSQTVLFVCLLLFCAIMVSPVSRRLRIPWPVTLVLVGFAGSEIITHGLQIDTGIRWYNFDAIIFYGLIPVLIFHSALNLDITALRRDSLPVLTLSLPVLIATVIVTGFILYYAIGHPAGFPLIAALLAAVLLSATDPTPAVATLQRAGSGRRVRSLLEGESLFNDAMAVVLFTILISMATQTGGEYSLRSVLTHFVMVFAGGLVLGLALALVVHMVLRLTGYGQSMTLLTVIAAYAGYILAEDVLQVSGVMTVLSAGLLMRRLDFNEGVEHDRNDCLRFWNIISAAASMLVFLLAGVTITSTMFTSQWLAMLYAILAVLISRFLVIIPSLYVTGKLPWTEPVTLREQFIVCWGGARGTITLALALSLPLSLDYYFTVQSMVYGVVLFSLFVQSTTIGWLVKKQ